MKRVIPDLGFIIVAAVIAILMAGRPPQVLQPAPASEGAQASVHAPVQASVQASVPAVLKPEQTGQPETMRDVAEAGKRNIFSASGRYGEANSSAEAVMPENPYELIGIVNESGMKALFRDYTGNVIRAGKGYRMPDGFMIERVEAQRVITARGEERKEFCLFGASGPAFVGKGMPNKSSDQPPVLIGILGGEAKKAVFRDQAGALTLLEVRRTLPDGSVITRIDSQSVTVRKGKKSEELKPRLTGHPAPPVLKMQAVASGQTAPAAAMEKRERLSTRGARPPTRGPGPASGGKGPAARIEDAPVKAPGGI